MKKYRVYVYMNEHQDIQEFTIQVEAYDVVEAQAKAIRTLNNVLTYAPIESSISNISVRSR